MKMKKLFTLLSLMALICLSANVWAQSTGTAPFPGATHTYSITPVTGTNLSYEWKVYDVGMNEVAAAVATVNTPTSASTTITWGTGVIPTTEYLVVVKETVDGCSNTRALPVVIAASNFDLIVTAGGDECYDGVVTVAWTGGQDDADVSYTHGDATIGYTVEATGIAASETWTFKPNFTYLDEASNTTEFTQVVVVKDGSNNTVTADENGKYTLTGPQTASVSVVVTNGNTYTNASALTAQNYTATLELSDVASGTGSVEKVSTPNNNIDSLDVKRPTTTKITAL